MKTKRALETVSLGEFENASGRIGAWDPCYGRGKSWPARTGAWKSQVAVVHIDDWGRRICRLHAWVHGTAPGPKSGMRVATIAGVDSGQMGIYDAGSIDETTTKDTDYDRICKMTLKSTGAGILPYGVVSSSGFGDGGYAVFTRTDEDGLVVEVMVEFIPEEEWGS